MIPFKYGQVVDGKDFCGRQKLIKDLSEFIISAQNVVLKGERRIGKTSLIFETLRRLKHKNVIKVDLLSIKSVHDLASKIIKASLDLPLNESVILKIIKGITGIRFQLGFDTNTGQPTISLDSLKRATPSSLEEVLDSLEKMNTNKNLVVIFDEFQEILKIPDSKETLAILRSRIQHQENITYIYAGSVRNEMDKIFNDAESPFFKSAITISVSAIERKEFESFLKEKFASGKREINDALLNHIFNYSDGVSGDIQQLCEAIWSVSDQGDFLTEKHLPEALNLIHSREQDSYQMICQDLNDNQNRCLIGLAINDGARATSWDFREKVGIPQSSTVLRALETLMKKRIIFKDNKKYRFNNPFFKNWIRLKN